MAASDNDSANDSANHSAEQVSINDSMEINLGTCHYGGDDEPATSMAVRADGTGWIGVCDQHQQEAEQDGFKVEADAGQG